LKTKTNVYITEVYCKTYPKHHQASRPALQGDYGSNGTGNKLNDQTTNRSSTRGGGALAAGEGGEGQAKRGGLILANMQELERYGCRVAVEAPYELRPHPSCSELVS
jgi:hypothetical protein